MDSEMWKKVQRGRLLFQRPNILSKAASSTPVESLAKQGVSVQQIKIPKGKATFFNTFIVPPKDSFFDKQCSMMFFDVAYTREHPLITVFQSTSVIFQRDLMYNSFNAFLMY